MELLELVWLIPALPLLGFLTLLVFGRKLGEPGAGMLATAMIGGSFLATVAVFTGLVDLPEEERQFTQVLFEWIPVGGWQIDVGFLADPLSITMCLFITGVGTLIHLYSVGYMHGDENFSKFFVYLNLFAFSMLMLVLGNNLLITFLGWEGVGACSYFLISFWFTDPEKASAGKKAFVTNRIGDWGFMVAIFASFAALGSITYTEILGVEKDADARALRRAYFKLSKEFHPDRYFRKNLGAFEARIERVFCKIAEAFEILSDPSARAEMEKSLAAAPKAAPTGPRLHGRTTPHAFSLLARIDRERRRKAKQYYETGVAARGIEAWVEAAQQLRLAIACDPGNAEYKEAFGEANRRSNELRAERYMKEADARYGIGEYGEAYKRYVDALHCRPFDAEANHRAAKLAWRIENDLKAAKEYAARACEVDPEHVDYRKTLGHVYNAAELHLNAQREFEAALRLAPGDEEARQELKMAKKLARRSPRGSSSPGTSCRFRRGTACGRSSPRRAARSACTAASPTLRRSGGARPRSTARAAASRPWPSGRAAATSIGSSRGRRRRRRPSPAPPATAPRCRRRARCRRLRIRSAPRATRARRPCTR